MTPSPTGALIWWNAGKVVLECSPFPAILLDSTDRIRAVNRLLVDNPTLPSDALLGRTWSEAWSFDSETATAALEALARARKNEQTHVALTIQMPQGDSAVTFLELSALGAAPEGVVVVTVLSTRVAAKREAGPAVTR